MACNVFKVGGLCDGILATRSAAKPCQDQQVLHMEVVEMQSKTSNGFNLYLLVPRLFVGSGDKGLEGFEVKKEQAVTSRRETVPYAKQSGSNRSVS